MTSYPAGINASNHALITVSDALRQRRTMVGTRWRRLTAGQQALLAVAHLRKGETYADLAAGFGIGTTTVFRYIREALGVLAALCPSLPQAMTVAAAKDFVILDGTLLSINPGWHGLGSRPALLLREAQAAQGERACHRRPRWPTGPGVLRAARRTTRHRCRPRARPYRGPTHRWAHVIADNSYRGSGFAVPQRRRPAGPETGRRRLSRHQREVNAAHARQRSPGERANAWRKSWKMLHKIRCCPYRATSLVGQGRPGPHPRWLTPSGKRSVCFRSRACLSGRASSQGVAPRTRARHWLYKVERNWSTDLA